MEASEAMSTQQQQDQREAAYSMATQAYVQNEISAEALRPALNVIRRAIGAPAYTDASLAWLIGQLDAEKGLGNG